MSNPLTVSYPCLYSKGYEFNKRSLLFKAEFFAPRKDAPPWWRQGQYETKQMYSGRRRKAENVTKVTNKEGPSEVEATWAGNLVTRHAPKTTSWGTTTTPRSWRTRYNIGGWAPRRRRSRGRAPDEVEEVPCMFLPNEEAAPPKRESSLIIAAVKSSSESKEKLRSIFESVQTIGSFEEESIAAKEGIVKKDESGSQDSFCRLSRNVSSHSSIWDSDSWDGWIDDHGPILGPDGPGSGDRVAIGGPSGVGDIGAAPLPHGREGETEGRGPSKERLGVEREISQEKLASERDELSPELRDGSGPRSSDLRDGISGTEMDKIKESKEKQEDVKKLKDRKEDAESVAQRTISTGSFFGSEDSERRRQKARETAEGRSEVRSEAETPKTKRLHRLRGPWRPPIGPIRAPIKWGETGIASPPEIGTKDEEEPQRRKEDRKEKGRQMEDGVSGKSRLTRGLAPAKSRGNEAPSSVRKADDEKSTVTGDRSHRVKKLQQSTSRRKSSGSSTASNTGTRKRREDPSIVSSESSRRNILRQSRFFTEKIRTEDEDASPSSMPR